MARLDWARVERLVEALAAAIRAEVRAGRAPPVDRILGVARGGWVPAALLAHALGVRCLESVQVRLYEGRKAAQVPELLGPRPPAAGPGGDPGGTWIVDEMLDTGRTLALLRARWPGARAAVLVGRPAAASGVLVGEALTTPHWVLFPWSPAAEHPDAPPEA